MTIRRYLEYQQNARTELDPGFNIGGPGSVRQHCPENSTPNGYGMGTGPNDNMYPDPYGRGGGMQNPEDFMEITNRSMEPDQIGETLLILSTRTGADLADVVVTR